MLHVIDYSLWTPLRIAQIPNALKVAPSTPSCYSEHLRALIPTSRHPDQVCTVTAVLAIPAVGRLRAAIAIRAV